MDSGVRHVGREARALVDRAGPAWRVAPGANRRLQSGGWGGVVRGRAAWDAVLEEGGPGWGGLEGRSGRRN